MSQSQPLASPIDLSRRATAVLTIGATASAGVAALHMILTAQRGIVCSAANGAADHCWACYAAPMLAAAALTSLWLNRTPTRTALMQSQ